MTELEKVTQQNAAMVEEASAAAGSLEEQSQALTGAVAVFRTDGQDSTDAKDRTVVAAPARIAKAQKPSKAQPRNTANRAPARPAAAKREAVTLKQDEGWQEF